MLSENNLRFSCPNCGQHLEVEARFAGSVFECPSCGQSSEIPCYEEETAKVSRPKITVVKHLEETPNKSSSGLKTVCAVFGVLCVVAVLGVLGFVLARKVVPMDGALYCVIDLSGGPNAMSYPVTYLNREPKGGFNTSEYKTTKLVLKRVEAGTFVMGDSSEDNNKPHSVTLTKPFYMGLFEVTQKQWYLVMGLNPSRFSGNANPVERVSYDDIRGSSAGAKWPVSNAVNSSSFLGRLRNRTKLDFDLPTESQWEYACRAGTETKFSYGDNENGAYMWYDDNSSDKTHEVGTKLPNKWGFYDMHGNVREWCLDWYDAYEYKFGKDRTDPKGSSSASSSGSYRVLRGGCWSYYASRCTSSRRSSDNPSDSYIYIGFRLSRTLP